MAFTNYQIFLALLQITTGSINTLSTKWADTVESADSSGNKKEFKHPFVQACAMFLGEFLCLLTFKAVYFTLRRKRDGSEDENTLTKGTREFNAFTLYIPAICDMVGTSLMYIGLNLTFASSFQMFRGAVIIFVALLSVAFLQRRLVAREWIGIFVIVLGLAMVGAADMLVSTDDSKHSRNDIITGDLLILTAQIITAVQMVYEEKFVAGLDIPALQAVGYEGLFGFATLGALLVPFYYIKVGPPFSDNTTGSLENVFDALYQIKNSWQILVSILGTVVSIAFFNYAGISVTKEISATTRMVLDSVRTLVIWVFSMVIGWQVFQPLTLCGFVFLLFGMCLYNNILICQTYRFIRDSCTRRIYGNVVNETNVIVNRPADDTSNP
ncbi:solute carrier family 35 member F6 [Sitodiplosis mosellana]|uniref:solute carrier family 35 member F6 n=1 Tax=Sitodiplosis mosellana TaxID=263140 RepID=UPI00244533DB|nr:solute carrier family 35 member F6 [Sitodiplosis mosellana]